MKISKAKRFLSAVVAAAIALCAVTVPVFADGTETVTPKLNLGDYVQMGEFDGYPMIYRVVAFQEINDNYSDINVVDGTYEKYANSVTDADIEATETDPSPTTTPAFDHAGFSKEYKDGYYPLLLYCGKPSQVREDTGYGYSLTSGEYSPKQTSGDTNRKSHGTNYWENSSLKKWLNSNDKTVEYNTTKYASPSYVDSAGFLTNFSELEKTAMVKNVTQRTSTYYWKDGTERDGGIEKHECNDSITEGLANYNTTAYYKNTTDTVFVLDIPQVITIKDYLGNIYRRSESSYGWDWLRCARADDAASYVRGVKADVPTNGEGFASHSADSVAGGIRPAFFLNPDFVTTMSVAGEHNGNTWYKFVDVTEKVGVVFSRVPGSADKYYITLKSLESDKKINRFTSADLVFKNSAKNIGYEITAAENITVTNANVYDGADGNIRKYHFAANEASGISGEAGSGITIGTVTFSGTGTLNFSVDADNSEADIANTVISAKVADNIVNSYTESGGDTTGLLVVNDFSGYSDALASGESGTITDPLTLEKNTLTVNVEFPNNIKDNDADYQNMRAVISGGDLAEDVVVEFGENSESEDDGAKALSTDTNGNLCYTFERNLTQNITYTVTISGAGYRTARYSVNMSEDKTLNFWNNVKDTPQVIEVGKDTSAVTKNFLAGDIVKDNTINIYDLSAVVSYFGTEGISAENYPEYAKYDLNRDGEINSKDVAYVLVSWGE